MNRLITSLFPPQASNVASKVDGIAFALLVLCGGVTLLVLITMTFFCVRYRQGSKASRAGEIISPHKWEISWTVIPLVLFCVIFVWAAKAFYFMTAPAPNVREVYVVGKQWMWKTQHLEGQREIDELHLPLGQPVKLIMTSQDVIHDFFVPAFRTKEDVLPDRYTTIWFTPTQKGQFHLFCSQYCGMDHSRMGGWVYVMEPQDYANWLTQQNSPVSLAMQGEQLFRTLGCSGCHSPLSKIHAPLLDGIYGRPVPLSDGTVTIADEQYLRDSIFLPAKQIAAGYEPVMPSYQNRISAEELNMLIAYIKSLKSPEAKTQ